MPGKQAKVVTPPMLKRMLRRVARSPFPARDRVMILLSVKAGLRACEIAGLDWSMVLDAQGRVSGTLNVRDVIAKNRGGRRIPMHPDLRRALERLARDTEPVGPVIRSYRGSHLGATAWSTGSRRCSGSSASRAARRTPAGAASSLSPPATSTARACTTNAPELLDAAAARRFLFKVRFLPMTSSQVATAYRRAFGAEAPAFVVKLDGLTPADFAIVARKAGVLGETDPRALAQWLEAEALAKPDAGRKRSASDLQPSRKLAASREMPHITKLLLHGSLSTTCR